MTEPEWKKPCGSNPGSWDRQINIASVLVFRPTAKSLNWTNEELAELFRVVDILGRAGVPIDTDMGQTDEGEPWFAFCRADTGDVIVHFSRIDGQFVAVSAATDAVVRGNNFRRVAEALVNRQPLILPAPSSGQKLFLHPSVILTALVATTLAQMKSWEGQEITAYDDASGGAPAMVSEASFTETLKTAFLDALNIVLRGFTGPTDVKHASGETSQSAGLGLGLGNLSLASVVAFAISVIQASPLQDASVTADSSSDASDTADGVLKMLAAPAVSPGAADNNARPESGGAERISENADSATVKSAPQQREIAPVAAVEKTAAAADKSDPAASIDASFTNTFEKEISGRLIPVDARADVAHQKLEPAAAAADITKAPQLPQAAVSEQKDAAALVMVQLAANTEHHQFTFTEITKEAIEIFFGLGALRSGDRGSVSVLGDFGGTIVTGSSLALAGGGEKSVVLTPGMALMDGAISFSFAASGGPSLNASDIVFAGGDPVAMARLNLITDFVNAADSKMTTSGNFQDILKPYWSGDKALTVVIFDSQNLPLNIFSFTSDVLFVEESQLAGATLDFSDSHLKVDLANGGDVMLLGVVNLTPLMTV
ncbi:MAG: hypothetical protein ABL951_03170 [Alphaproteobacteria bacterium]